MVGSNDQGQLGLGNNDNVGLRLFAEQPIFLSSLFSKGIFVDNVACGFAHTLIVSKNGQIFSWGYGKFGALGLGHLESRYHPTELTHFSNLFNSSNEIASL